MHIYIYIYTYVYIHLRVGSTLKPCMLLDYPESNAALSGWKSGVHPAGAPSPPTKSFSTKSP